MAQGIDSVTGELLPAFELPANGATQLVVSATGAVTNSVAIIGNGFHEFVSDVDCFIAVGAGVATIPVAGTPGGLPMKAGVAKVYHVSKGAIVSAIGLAAFNLHITKV